MARQTSAIGTPGRAAAMPWSIACTTSAYFSASSADASPTTTVRQICASWPRTLGVISARMMSPFWNLRPVEGCTARLCGPAQSSRKLSSAPSVFMNHLSSTASSSSLMPGRAIVEQMAIAKLGDAGRLARVAISSSVLVRAASNTSLSADGAAGRAAVTRSAIDAGEEAHAGEAGVLARAVAERGGERIDDVVGADHARLRALLGRALRIPGRRRRSASCAPSPRRIAAAGPSDLKPVRPSPGSASR